MTRAALALAAFCASPALADSPTRASWGAGTHGPCVVSIEPSAEPGVWATVAFDNALIMGQGSVHQLTLTLDGLPVAVTVAEAPNETPDTLAMPPPPGYLAEPPTVTVQEGERGVVRLRVMLVG